MAAPHPFEAGASSELREFAYTRADFETLRTLSFAHSGIRVPDDKFDMFYSRLAKRLRALGLSRFSEYCELLKGQAEPEFTEFINAITTNLTSFFRETHHFDFLAKSILPDLVSKQPRGRRLRIWSAGCSTGQEPYSIAMTLLESHPQLASWDVRILATDLDTQVLSVAEQGVYPNERAGGLSDARKHQWFLRGKGSQSNVIRAKPELRQWLRFKQLNLMGEWPMRGPFDVIFCRNVLIYFDQPTKLRLAERYAQLLPDGAHLFIGHSESLQGVNAIFDSLGHTMYRRRDGRP